MPKHATENHIKLDEVIVIDSEPYINSERVVYVDVDDGLSKRYIMDKGLLVLQYWDGTIWKNV